MDRVYYIVSYDMFNYLSLLIDGELFEDWVMSILFIILFPELITVP